MTYLVCGTLALSLATLLLLIRVLGKVQEVLDLAKRQHEVYAGKFYGSIFAPYGPHSSRRYSSIKGWAIWVHKDGKWQLEDDLCAPGFEPGNPPRVRGAYDGQRVKQEGSAK